MTETQIRLFQKLCDDLGETILKSLEDPSIHEIMLNSNGELWIDSAQDGQRAIGNLNQQQALSIIHNVAGILNLIISPQSPRLEAELPYFSVMNGERFSAVVSPIVSSPCFSIRKRSKMILSLEDYVQSQRLSRLQLQVIKDLIHARKNILVCGGPGSGKTTFTNALILEAVSHEPAQRFLILEDISELQCQARNFVSLLSNQTVSLRDLVRTAMRMRPDRILIGEVRGAEALDLLKAWNTGCPGGISTIHANSAEEAIQRLADLSMESGLHSPPWNLIANTIGAIIFLLRKNYLKGFIEKIVTIKGREHDKFLLEKLD